MNEIGRSSQGGYIIEMTESEYITFVELERAISGEERDWYSKHKMQGAELSSILLVIRHYTEGLFLINSLQHYVNQLRDTFQAGKQND